MDFRRFSLSQKILLGILPLFLLFISVSVAVHNRFQEQAMLEQAQQTAHTYGELIREALVSMMVNNLAVDSTFVARVDSLEQFDHLTLLVNDLRLREEVVTPELEDHLQRKRAATIPPDTLQQRVLATGIAAYARIGDRFRAVIPFSATKVCQKCHRVPLGYTLGASDIRISFRYVSDAAADTWKRSLLIFLVFVALVVGAASIMFTRFVSAPVDRMVHAAERIARGDLEPSANASAGGPPDDLQDELAFLAARFDDMRASLRNKIDELDRTNQTLSGRNVELEEALTRLRQAQEELVRNERLAVAGKMTAQLSHEVNNPIHNIQSLVDSSLRKLEGNAPVRELLEIALDEVRRMAALTRQMLDLYRGSVVDMTWERVEVGRLLEDVCLASRPQLSDRGVQIVLDLAPDLPAVSGSADKLKQVMFNLITNARDAMPAGGTITLSGRHEDREVRITVADTGAGIPAEIRGRIFDAFFTTKREASGVGLGLSVVHAIVTRHNGTIAVESTPGQGTRFRIVLPRA
jgi:signal transduction histidine kinase